AGFAQLAGQLLADLVDLLAGVAMVEVIRGLLELARRQRLTQLDDPVLHLVVGEDQDHQHPVFRQAHELDMAQGEIGIARHRDTPTKRVTADSRLETLPSRSRVSAGDSGSSRSSFSSS